MTFSIIVPVFNSSKTIKCALDSIKKQSFDDFEVLIVDDGSNDTTAKICREFTESDNRFKYFFQENMGVSSARNRGIKLATGNYLIFLDSDDKFADNHLTVFKQMIDFYPDCNNFWVDYYEIESQDKEIPNKIRNENTVSLLDRNDTVFLPALWNKAFKKSIIDSNNISMPVDLSLGEDFIFNFYYLDAAGRKIAYANTKTYYYTKSANGTLDSKFRLDLLYIYKKLENVMLEHYKKWKLEKKAFEHYYEYVFYNRIKVLYNTWRPECTMTKREKIKYNNSILRSNEFVHAFERIDCYINPLYKIAYKIGSWRLILLLDTLVKIKKHITKKN